MLLGIAGVTGVGKSYYKDKIVKELNFEKVKIITTREKRENEKNNEDKIFLTQEEIKKLREEGKIAYEFEYLGNTYAYTKQELFSNKNMVFEMHYATVFDLYQICPQLCTIYLMPKNIEIAKTKIKERKLKQETEQKRLIEINEHYERITKDEKLRNKFDYIIYNDYNKGTDEEVIKIVKNMINNKRGN